ncbi:helix-turn-helix domain-containing protein [Singulisphaera sp. Ch08]|uniref:Helix-turn-helix domain-containing protein n=1 Tax=Singulisphaera sp. Ch08 TaxID=3120278 RepID=A0AAU7C8U1_9BACT
MDPEKRKRLEAAGFKFGDAADFLGLSEAENQIVEFRVALARAIREGREEKGLTQKQLADLIGSSQSRIAKVEAATDEVTVDLMLKALVAVGRELTAVVAGMTVKPKAIVKSAVTKPKAAKVKAV